MTTSEILWTSYKYRTIQSQKRGLSATHLIATHPFLQNFFCEASQEIGRVAVRGCGSPEFFKFCDPGGLQTVQSSEVPRNGQSSQQCSQVSNFSSVIYSARLREFQAPKICQHRKVECGRSQLHLDTCTAPTRKNCTDKDSVPVSEGGNDPPT